MPFLKMTTVVKRTAKLDKWRAEYTHRSREREQKRRGRNMSQHMVKEIHILRVERVRETISPSITPPQKKETHEKGTKYTLVPTYNLKVQNLKVVTGGNHHL